MKTKTTHTPGPWHVGTGWIYASPSGDPKGASTVCTINVGPVNDENARLIAAAPELLASFKEVHRENMAAEHYTVSPERALVLHRIDEPNCSYCALIARAEGR